MLKDLEEIDSKREEVSKAVEETGKDSAKTISVAIASAQAAFNFIDSMFTLSGRAIDANTRLAIQSAFSVAQILIPLFTAQTTPLTPTQVGFAAFGLSQVAASLAAAALAEQTTDDQTSDIKDFSSSVNNFASSFYYL